LGDPNINGSDIFNIINKDADIFAYIMRISYALIPFCGIFYKNKKNILYLIISGIPIVYFGGKECVEKIVAEYKYKV
jgi:hypothetical protein